jgi:hypothetical protein
LLIPNLLFKIKKEKRAAEFAANHRIAFQNEEKRRQNYVANTELAFQNEKKENRS